MLFALPLHLLPPTPRPTLQLSEALAAIFLLGAPCDFEVKRYVPCMLGEEFGRELVFSLALSQHSLETADFYFLYVKKR